MVRNIVIRILLFPFSILYGLGVMLRNFFYQVGLLKGVRFNIPIISVGNLTVGGAGKSPHIEYLIRLLSPYIDVATLSRGYRRKSKGYLEVQKHFTAKEAGDEPLQFKRKFPESLVTVSESRALGIPKIVKQHPNIQSILLDDAFQHLEVIPSLNILLTEYDRPYFSDFLLPSGRLREWRSAYQRADIIIVSKCPMEMTEEDRGNFKEKLGIGENQQLYFSYYDYGQPYHIFNPNLKQELQEDQDVLLNCAIAGTDYLVNYLSSKVSFIKLLEYEDHHYYSNYEIAQMKKIFDNIPSENKLILTTEKDAMRMELHKEFISKEKLPVFALPVEVKFHFKQKEEFDQMIKSHLLDFKS